MNEKDIIGRAKQAIDQARVEKKRMEDFVRSVGPAIVDAISPALDAISENSRISKEEMLDAVASIRVDAPDVPHAQVDVNIPDIKVPTPQVTVNVPDVIVPEIKIPEIKLPTINVPEPKVTVNVPETKFPDFPAFPEYFSLKGVSKKQPLPVQMVDLAGNPYFPGGATVGGGRGDFFTIKDIQDSSGSSIIDTSTGAMKVTGNFSVTSSASSTLAQLVDSDGNSYTSANPLQIAGSISTTPGATFYASDAVGSVNVIQSITLETKQLSGSIDSVYVTGIFGTIGTVTIDPDGNPVYGGTSSGGTVQVQDSLGSSITSFGSGDSKGLAVAIVDASGNQITSFGGGTQYADGGTASIPTGTVALGDTGEESGNVFALSTFSGVTSSGTLRIVQATDSVSSVNIVSSASLTVTGITTSVSVNIADSSGVGYSGSNPLPISDAGGSLTVDGTVSVSGISATLGTNIVDSSGVAYSGSNPVPISGAVSQSGTWNIGTVTTLTGVTNSLAVVALDRDGNPLTTGPIDNGDAATALRVVQAGNSVSSVSVTSITGPIAQGDEASALRVVHAGNSAVSVTATQTGTWNIGTVTTVTGITNSLASNIVDSSGVAYSGSNPVPVTGTVVVSSVTATTGSAIVDSSGVMYGSANPMHISVHDAVGSTIGSFGSGDSKGLAVAIIDGSGNQITSFGGGTQYAEGATASTYTGTAVMFAEASSDAAKVVSSVDPLPVTLSTALSSSIDSVLSRPIKLRGALSTAYATLSSNSETTLLAATAGAFHDLVWIKFSNTSTGAVTIDLRDVTAGNIVDTYEVPGNGVVGISMAVPYPQGNQGNAWTVDYNDSDLSNTTVYVSGLFANE